MTIAREILAAVVAELRSDATLAGELRALLGASPPAATPEAVYMRVADYARRVSLGERTVWAMVARGLPTVGSGRGRRVDVREADVWIRDQRGHVDDAVERGARASARRAAGRASR